MKSMRIPRLAAQAKASALIEREWLDASVYKSFLDFLLCTDAHSARPLISPREWIRNLKTRLDNEYIDSGAEVACRANANQLLI